MKKICFKRTILFLTGICLMMSCSACQSSVDVVTRNQNEFALIEGYSRYQNGVFGFSVDFPSTWICESEPYYYATEQTEASPDAGVLIYIDSQKEDCIRVYGQNGAISTDYVVRSNYKKIDVDESCDLYVLETDGYYTAQVFFKDNKHISVTINMSAKAYKEHEEKIMNLLKSITWK